MKIATITRNLRHYVQCVCMCVCVCVCVRARARAYVYVYVVAWLNLQIFAVTLALFHKYAQNREHSPSRELNDVINNHEIKQCRD